jgi:acyl-CoA thioesterase-1
MNGLYGGRFAALQRLLVVMALLVATSGVAVAAAPRPAAAKPTASVTSPSRTVLVIGDSLSAAYGLRANQGWVSLTEQRLRASRPGWRVVNASISGDTTAGGAARIARELARSRPAVVVIELGANDGLRGLDLAASRANLDRMIRLSRGAGARVLLLGMRLPPNFGPAYTQRFERMYAELARQHQATLLPFFLAPIATDRRNFQADNLHPTAAAQAKLRDHVWPALAPLLK